MAVTHSLDSAGVEELRQRLRPLLDDDNPFLYSARELEALVTYKAGDVEGARTLLRQLVDDPRSPRGIRPSISRRTVRRAVKASRTP